jgi:undecaprenyl-diphosphatase
MIIKNYFKCAGICFLLIFIFLSIIINYKITNQFDLIATNVIQNSIPINSDSWLSIFSLLGSFEIITLILIIILYLRKQIFGIIVLGYYILGLILEMIGKNIIKHPGPPVDLFRYNLGFIFPSSGYQTGNSFPSGHSLRIGFICVILCYILFKAQKINNIYKVSLFLLIIIFATIMLITRISLGEHWTSDVLAGFSLGVGLGLLSTHVYTNK